MHTHTANASRSALPVPRLFPFVLSSSAGDEIKVHGTLYRLMGRARPSRAEVDILRGMTKQLMWWFKERSQ